MKSGNLNDEIRKPHYMLNPNVKLMKPASFLCDIIIILLSLVAIVLTKQQLDHGVATPIAACWTRLLN